MIGPHEQPAQPALTDQIVVLGGPPPPLDLEFSPTDLSAIFGEAGLSLGRCFGSKSTYRRLHRQNIFIPNANVFCRRHG